MNPVTEQAKQMIASHVMWFSRLNRGDKGGRVYCEQHSLLLTLLSYLVDRVWRAYP